MSKYKDFLNEMYFEGFSTSPDAEIFRVPENFDRYKAGPGWEAYRGANDWENGNTGVAVYFHPEGYNKEMARIWFEVKYPDHLAELVTNGQGVPPSKDVEKWGRRAAVRWLTTADRIRKATRQFHGPHDGYAREWVQRKPWRECFVLALESERMKPFVKRCGIDRTQWVGMKRDMNESKYWFMGAQGELRPVSQPNFLSEDFAKGNVGVGYNNLWGHRQLNISYDPSHPLVFEQWETLKDLAVETGADCIKDLPFNRQVNINESRLLFENFHENKDWFVYEGANTVTAVFEDNSRQTFKIHYRDNRNEDRDKHRTKAARTWKKLAMEIRKSGGLTEAGNPVVIPWSECFQQALEKPEMMEFVDDLRASPIFEAFGYRLTPKQPIGEMTFDDLLRSTANYKDKADVMNGTETGATDRVKGAQDVRAKSLRVVSTLGKDNEEHETSMFSYKTNNASGDPRKNHPRWSGWIRFKGKQNNKSPVMPTKEEQDVDVNCNCPDYKYVWAKANADADAGVTGGGGLKQTTQAAPGKAVNIFEAPDDYDPNEPVPLDKRWKSGAEKRLGVDVGGNDNNDTRGKGVRNPQNTPGLCKHLIALAKFLNTKTSPVAQKAPGTPEKEPVAPTEPKKPENIFEETTPMVFERMKQFALQNPTFDVPYEDLNEVETNVNRVAHIAPMATINFSPQT